VKRAIDVTRAIGAAFIVAGLTGLAGCATVPGARDDDGAQLWRGTLDAVLWMQSSEEYRALAAQVYAQAMSRLPALIEPGTAALEQADAPAQALAALPTAIVLDVDETVLDNSYHQARLLLEGRVYAPQSWDAWVREAVAPPIPGALEFLTAAKRAGHRIFYVTNRECPPAPAPVGEDPCPQRTATMRNLATHGFPDADRVDSFLLLNGKPAWHGSDKGPRRAALASEYRIVALFGDDLRDFVDRGQFAARRSELAPLFGKRWFLLPNPAYGSWERALVGADCTGTPLECKYSALKRAP